MTFREIANKIDKSEENTDSINFDGICEDLDISYCGWPRQERLKSYWITNWLCTDTWVGLKMYFLDDEPVCVGFQSGRKSDEQFSWFSKECSEKVRNYILSNLLSDNSRCDYCSFDEEVGDSYKISFNSQVLNWENALYQGKPFKMIERILETPNYGIDTNVKIEIDGEEKIVSIEDIDFKFHIND